MIDWLQKSYDDWGDDSDGDVESSRINETF